jgi:hypothetical protein
MMGRRRNWKRVRQKRDKRLAQALAVLERHRTQKEFGLATSISDVKAREWAHYAQDLRDITLQKGAGPIIWPEEPGT